MFFFFHFKSKVSSGSDFFVTLGTIDVLDEIDDDEEEEEDFDESQIRERTSGMSDLRQSVRQDLTTVGTSDGRTVNDQDLG